MNDEQRAPSGQGTTYGRQKSKWNKKMTPAGGHEGPSPRIIVAFLLALVMLVFIIRNGHATRINFLFFSWDTTVRWSIFIAIALGIALDRLIIWGMKKHKGGQATEQPTVEPE